MSRARRAPSSPVQLFPFLAVLVSTMGALVLLLLAINRQVSLQAIAAAIGLLAKQTSAEEETLASRHQQLEQEVAAIRGQLRRAQSEQTTVEQQLIASDRRIRSDAARTESLRHELNTLQSKRTESERSIESLLGEIAAIQAAKAQFIASQQNSDRTFVPVVHPGANGTARQPIYIECTSKAVILHPEEIAIPTGALDPEVGAGDALARAVRALADYYLNRDVGKENAAAMREWEPYPLLLVRPDGVSAYYLARQALEQLELPFGYELVEADWVLRYPDSDPQARAVAVAALRSASFGSGVAGRRTGIRTQRGNSIGDSEPGGETVPARQPVLVGSLHPVPSDWMTANRGNTGLSEPRDASSQDPPGQPQGASSDPDHASGSADEVSDQTKGSSNPARSSGAAEAEPRSNRPAGGPPSIASSKPTDDHTTPSPPRGRAVREPKSRSASASDEAGDSDARGLPMPANPQSSGKIAIPRKIVVSCTADELVVEPSGISIAIPSDGSPDAAVGSLCDEVDRQVVRWGPPGMTFRWEPQLMFRVHRDGLESYYRLRFALVGSSISVEHVIVSDGEFDLNDSVFLKETQRSILSHQPSTLNSQLFKE